MVAIEERGFIIGVGIDMDAEHFKEGQELTLTYQFVVPGGVGGPSQEGRGSQEPVMNVSATGKGMFAIDQEMSSLTSKVLFFEHLKVLVISEDVVKTPHLLADLLDTFIRDPNMRRGIKVLIVAGEAKNILDIEPAEEKLPAIYIDTLLEDTPRNNGFIKPIRIGEIQEFQLNNNSYTIPKFESAGNKIQYRGGEVFHGMEKKMVGSFTKNEMLGLNLVTAEKQEGILEVNFEGHVVTFKMEDVKNNIKINTEDIDNLKIAVNLDVEGNIKEVFGTKNLMNPKTLAQIEKAIAGKIEKLAYEALEKGQKELNADVFRFDSMLKQRHYDTWIKIKDNWDHGENYFDKSTIDVTAKVKIHTTGILEQTKTKKK